jgi:indole-3-acetate monooxygenase
MVQTLSPVLAATDLPERIADAVERYRDAADAVRMLPPALVEELRAAGAFRLYTPREFGGAELPLPDVLDVLERIGRLDGPVAWNVWNGNMGFGAAMLPAAGAERIWGGGADPMVVNSARPTGTAVRDGAGWVLSGRWDIVSGIGSADRVALFCLAEGQVMVCFVAVADVAVLDTWDVTGMRGTGSGSVVAEGVRVPAELIVSPFAPARIDRPLYRVPAFTLASTGCAAAVLGIAAAALDELVALAPGKGTDSGAPLAQRAHAQAAIAEADAALRAARLLLRAAATDVQDAATAGREVGVRLRGALRGAMCHAATTARDVLTAVYPLASSSALYRGQRLERLFRDGMVAAQHGVLAAAHRETVGRIRLGLDPGTPIL